VQGNAQSERNEQGEQASESTDEKRVMEVGVVRSEQLTFTAYGNSHL